MNIIEGKRTEWKLNFEKEKKNKKILGLCWNWEKLWQKCVQGEKQRSAVCRVWERKWWTIWLNMWDTDGIEYTFFFTTFYSER